MIDNTWLVKNTRKVTLPDDSLMYQHKQGQKVSSDNENFNRLIMERFSLCPNKPRRVLELGIGSGINSIMLKKHFPNWFITGIEIDEEQAELATYNSILQDLEIEVITGDLREFNNNEKYDLIIANPPYKKELSGKQSPHHRRNIARFELTCNMSDIFSAIERNISSNGQAWLLYSSERAEELKNYITQGNFKEIDMIKKNNIIISGFKYVAN